MFTETNSCSAVPDTDRWRCYSDVGLISAATLKWNPACAFHFVLNTSWHGFPVTVTNRAERAQFERVKHHGSSFTAQKEKTLHCKSFSMNVWMNHCFVKRRYYKYNALLSVLLLYFRQNIQDNLPWPPASCQDLRWRACPSSLMYIYERITVRPLSPATFDPQFIPRMSLAQPSLWYPPCTCVVLWQRAEDSLF